MSGIDPVEKIAAAGAGTTAARYERLTALLVRWYLVAYDLSVCIL